MNSITVIEPSAANLSRVPPRPHHPAYRPDIDGLRAVAVTSVVLFHAGLWPFTGGFVGVDIFFVISGYLIGSMILRDVAARRFSFAEFYARRARRILPALVLVVATVCTAGWFLLTAAEYTSAAATAMTALLGTSNFSFWAHQDYFEANTQLAPLLMTWSLGVEEQFYLLFPLLILAVSRFMPRHLIAVIGSVTLLSFLFSVWCTVAQPMTAFYLLPARAWEMGAGLFLAAFSLRSMARPQSSHRLVQAAGFAGLAAILVSVFAFDPGIDFPGYAAALPVAGTVALIWARDSAVNRHILSARPVVFVGLVSYSWYLWHWPLMSLLRVAAIQNPPAWQMTLCAAIAFALAVLSWRFVERPFRAVRARPRNQLPAYAAVLAAGVALCALIKHEGGLPWRVSPSAARVEATILAGRGDCLGSYSDTKPDISPRCDSVRPGQSGMAVFGDSHASALSAAFRDIATREHRGLALFTKSSCGPFLGVRVMRPSPREFTDACATFMAESFAAVARRPEIDTVVLVGFWRSYDTTLGQAKFHEGLLNAVQTMRAANKRVVIVEDVPVWDIDPTHVALAAAISARGWLARRVWPTTTVGLTDAEPRPPTATSLEIDAALHRLVQDQAIEWIGLRDIFCASSLCTFQRNDALLYIDRHHLSLTGAMQARDALAKRL